MQNQWNVEVVRCINEWANGKESVHKWVNEPMYQRVDEPKNESVSQWTIEWMNQRISVNEWMSESANQWISESVNQWITDLVNQTMTEPMNLWIHESMIQWINEPIKEGMGEWMDGWASYFFVVEILLHSPTFLLKHLFSQLLLLWAATYLGYLPWAASQLTVASATKVFSLCSCCNAFCSLQLQSHIAQEQHYGQGLPFAQLLQCV